MTEPARPASAVAGSFRDPAGTVFERDGRIFRTVMPAVLDDYTFVRAGDFLPRLVAAGRVIGEQEVNAALLGTAAAGASRVLEHPRLPFVSHPYEWCFPALKAAALLHLDIALEGLDQDIALVDASAYNVQFRGPRPLFIDALSFRRYREGEFWLGHRQFCEQFLNPLLLRALFGVAHNAWYRGAPEGIATPLLARLLRWRHCFDWNLLVHVLLPARLQGGRAARARAGRSLRERRLPRAALRRMLDALRGWIARLEPADGAATPWADYARANSYADDEARTKADVVARFAAAVRPGLLWDLGCNSGEYSEVALTHGATRVIGFDADQGALEGAWARAVARGLDLLPLYLDAADPTPGQGWEGRERAGLHARGPADALLALAVVHHLAIGRNVPLPRVVAWLLGLAPRGVIEFVPPEDPMVEALQALRDRRFPDYTAAAFEHALGAGARIVERVAVKAGGRTLYWYERDAAAASTR